jgi:hypothetical protein
MPQIAVLCCHRVGGGEGAHCVRRVRGQSTRLCGSSRVKKAPPTGAPKKAPTLADMPASMSTRHCGLLSCRLRPCNERIVGGRAGRDDDAGGRGTRTHNETPLTTAPPTIAPMMISGASGPASHVSIDARARVCVCVTRVRLQLPGVRTAAYPRTFQWLHRACC